MNPRALATPTPTAIGAPIVSASHVNKAFTTPDGEPLRVLEDISLDLNDGEIVALLGKSGSGKSTLLRCLAGLIAPTSGEIEYRGRPVKTANPGVAMVFQTFALLPWLTVLQNVELGLEARGGLTPAERRSRAERVIDLIGLDGFESAYPKELSGGMRQRVGFARALVVEPDALFMDEPFSALDVLTAENLRSELLGLWARDDFPTSAMLLVTHNIEEAVLLADRLFVLAANPGRIQATIPIDLPRPRDRRSPEFESLVDRVYGILTERETPATEAPLAPRAVPTEMPLPRATVGGMAGLLEILAAHGGREDLADLTRELVFEVDDLLPLVDATLMLGFAHIDAGDLELTEVGRQFVSADILQSKELFARQARDRAPLVRAIWNSLHATQDGTLKEDFFVDALRRGFAEDEARHQLELAIDWGRYGELFDFDANSGALTLDTGSELEPQL
jgi:NitT/TauT family transport system ATP-binding protein